jgi:hypothetical protein
MVSARDEMQQWDLPHLKETLLLKSQDKYWLYDVKFYPYTASREDPMFAVAGTQHVNLSFHTFTCHVLIHVTYRSSSTVYVYGAMMASS